MSFLLLDNAPVPANDPIATPPAPADTLMGRPDTNVGKITQPWLEYFNRSSQTTNASTVVLNRVTADAQQASIAATDFTGGAINKGLYKIEYYARITQAASTSSSLTITFSWTDEGVACSLATAAITGNTVTTVSSSGIMVAADAATPIRYATTYASVGGTPMQYKLRIALIKVSA